MLLRFPVFRVALLLVLVLLAVSLAFQMPALADGGIGEPFPPDQSPPSAGSTSASFMVITLLSILQFVL